jgi:6-phospho-beta-glucosidase
VLDGGHDLLPNLLADDERLESFEEGRLFGAEWLRSVGMIPVKPLFYYYREREALDAMRHGHVRAAYLQATQDAFFDATAQEPAEALSSWERVRAAREAHYMDEAWSTRPAKYGRRHGVAPGGYGAMALKLVDAVRSDGTSVAILNVRNRSSLPFLDPDAIVEVPCIVGPGGILPVAIGDIPLEQQGLIVRVRAAERLAINAATEGSRSLALSALALHPLVASVDVARRILDAHLGRQRELREQLT